jgi:hypothetical protein
MEKETGVVIPEIGDLSQDPELKGVPDLRDVPVLKAFKAWHYQMPDGSVYRHTEILDFKGVVDQEKVDSDFDQTFVHQTMSHDEYLLFTETEFVPREIRQPCTKPYSRSGKANTCECEHCTKEKEIE